MGKVLTGILSFVAGVGATLALGYVVNKTSKGGSNTPIDQNPPELEIDLGDDVTKEEEKKEGSEG